MSVRIFGTIKAHIFLELEQQVGSITHWFKRKGFSTGFLRRVFDT